jgi:tight adherence protein C
VTLGVDEWIGLRLSVALLALICLPAFHRLPLAGIVTVAPLLVLAGWSWTAAWLHHLAARRERLVLKELPTYLDIVTLCVESGATLTTALRLAVDKSPRSPLRQAFERVLREVRIGRPRVEAFTYVARLYDIECLTALAAALVQSEGAGVSLGGVLRAQSEQRATERQLRAERSAMQAPVKMLGPLVLCVFPCTFIVIAVPVVVRVFLETG